MIKTILIFLALTSNAFAFGLLNQMDAGSPAEDTYCYEPDERVAGTEASAKIANGDYYIEGQSFTAECSISDAPVTIAFQARTIGGAGCTDTEFYIDDDTSIMDSPICSNTSGNTINTTGAKTVTITGCTLTQDETYYFAIACRSANGSVDYFYIDIDDGGNPYAGGSRYNGLFSSGVIGTLQTGDDLEFQLTLGQ